MVATAGCRYYNVLSVILVTQSCIIHQVKGYFMLCNSCKELFYYKMPCTGTNLRKCMGAVVLYSAILFFLRLYLSHSNTQYVKRQVILWSTTLVYHSHIEKCCLGDEKVEKLNLCRPSWKMASKAIKTQIQPGKHNIRVQRPQIIKNKVFINFSSNM